jgi:biotin carboxylase
MHIAFVDSNTVGLAALRTARRHGHHVSFVTSRRFAGLMGGRQVLDNAEVAPTNAILEIETALDEEELFNAVSSLHRERPLDAIITVVDFCTHPVARCAQRMGLPGTDPVAVALAQDKAACRARIAAHGIRSIPYALVGSAKEAKQWAARQGYPVIAKPKRGAASLLTAKITQAAELDAYFSSLDRALSVPQGVIDTLSNETLLEAYVDGPLFSVEMAAAQGEYLPMALSWRKRCMADPSVELGTVMPAPVSASAAKAMKDYAVAVARSLELDLGIFHIELIYGANGPVLVEVNPRIMGGNIPTVFTLATDVDPFEMLIGLHATGRLPDICRKVAPLRAAATRSLGPSVAARVRPDLRSDWDRNFRPEVALWTMGIEAGLELPAMDSTFYARHFQLVRASAIEASLMAEWIISVTAEATGLQLRQSMEDYLAL